MPQPSIEVIIPVRNMTDQLQDVLNPLLAQRTNRDTVTVADDASTDDTSATAGKRGARVFRLPESRGPYYARQVVARLSDADVLLFVDARCRPLPGLLEAHRQLQSRPGIALSCTDVRTRSGPSLAARVAAHQQPFRLDGMIGVPGRPDFYPTANLGIQRTAFEKVGGFRAMRSGADADICWRIQDQSLGDMAVDTRVLMEWEPRSTMRDLASQWKRYGASTAYLEWVYGEYSPSSFGTVESFGTKLRSWLRRAKDKQHQTCTEAMARAAVSCVYQLAYVSAKRKSDQFRMPAPYDLRTADIRRRA